MYARTNKYGFLETPYIKFFKGKATNEIKYLSAKEEEKYIIAQSNINLNYEKNKKTKLVPCRYKGEFSFFSRQHCVLWHSKMPKSQYLPQIKFRSDRISSG